MRVAVHDYAGHPFQFELSRALAASGHTVRHFYFADDAGPKGASSVQPGDPDGFSVCPISVRWRYSKSSLPRRCVGDLLYARRIAREITAFRPDIVLSGNTPLDAQAAIARAAERAGAAFVFWVQDFYSVAMQRLLARRWLGIGRLIAQRYHRLETRLLTRSDAIVLISADFRHHLPRAIPPSRIEVIRNWGALGLIDGRPKDNPWAAKHALIRKFVFLYTGTLGLKHDPGLLLALADAFADDADVEIVVVATGLSRDELERRLHMSTRNNLRLLPLQPASEFPDVLGTADVLIALLEQDAAEFSVPSKILNYLCAGRPTLLSAPVRNLSAEIIRESGGGIAVDAADPDGFVEAARKLRRNKKPSDAMGRCARSYAERHFDIGAVKSAFEEVFHTASGARFGRPADTPMPPESSGAGLALPQS